ncbi:hypothetical protein GCM10027346_04310 [Hymenobacter seoulensis]
MRTLLLLLVITLISIAVAALGLLWVLAKHYSDALREGYVYLYFFILIFGGWVYLLAYPVYQGIMEKSLSKSTYKSMRVGATLGIGTSFLVLISNFSGPGTWYQSVLYVATFGLSGCVYGLLCHWLLLKRSLNG